MEVVNNAITPHFTTLALSIPIVTMNDRQKKNMLGKPFQKNFIIIIIISMVIIQEQSSGDACVNHV